MDAIEDFVSKYHILSSASLKKFRQQFTKKTYNKNDVLYHNEESSSKFFILTEGIARSVIKDSSQKEKTRSLFKAPTLFIALTAELENRHSSIEFNCLTDVVLYESDLLDFIELTHKRHDISILYSRFLEKAFARMKDKVSSLTTLDATERYLHLKNQIVDIEDLIQLNHIASYLNITPVQLSRIRKNLYRS